MSDTIVKTQLRSISVTSSNGGSNGGDKTPTTPKLMINHGKPNFTIPRSSTKSEQNGDNETIANGKNNNYYPYKSAGIQSYSNNYNYSSNNNNNIVIGTKFNGAFKPTNLPIAQKQPHQNDTNENEASKVVLRRAKVSDTTVKQDEEDESVPEFIRHQRRIQERLAKENILDFETRRSGYFTHVMISPTTPNRVSYGATMSSPPVVKALETPAPLLAAVTAIKEPSPSEIETKTETEPKNHTEECLIEPELTNGDRAFDLQQHEIAEEEEVAKAIAEVNKAVEGEDDEIKEELNIEEIPEAEEATAIPTTWEALPVQNELETTKEQSVHVANHEPNITAVSVSEAETFEREILQKPEENHTTESAITAQVPEPSEISQEIQTHVEVVQVHAPKDNGHNDDITISHTNGFDGPSIPAPDPSGSLGVNYEPKTIVSFSKDLSSEPNVYPDTVKVISQNDDVNATPVDEALQELSKLKFQIIAGEKDVQVKPVPRDE